MRASNNRTNPRYSGDSIQRSWTSLLAGRMQWTAARKSKPSRQILARKPRYSTRKARSWVALELSEALTWGFFLRPKSNPRWSTEMKPSSWDTSVFVPESSRIAAAIAPGRVATPNPSLPPPPHFATFPLGLSCEGMGERDADALGGLDNLFGSERPAGRAERRPRQTKKHPQSQEAHE